jgi:hypothetical protein
MCLLRSRVRLPNSAGRRLAGNVPGESGGGGTSGSLSRQGMRESPGGEALTAVYLLHRVSAGPGRPEPGSAQAYSGKDSIPTLSGGN